MPSVIPPHTYIVLSCSTAVCPARGVDSETCVGVMSSKRRRAVVGLWDGAVLGVCVGALLGATLGALLGSTGVGVGATDGDAEGATVGDAVGASLGAVVGAAVGAVVGDPVGMKLCHSSRVATLCHVPTSRPSVSWPISRTSKSAHGANMPDEFVFIPPKKIANARPSCENVTALKSPRPSGTAAETGWTVLLRRVHDTSVSFRLVSATAAAPAWVSLTSVET